MTLQVVRPAGGFCARRERSALTTMGHDLAAAPAAARTGLHPDVMHVPTISSGGAERSCRCLPNRPNTSGDR
jgi:hypothetical protein